MVRRLRMLIIASTMAAILAGSSVAIASAHVDKFIWKYTNATCFADGMSARGVIIEQGTTGTTWMRITARFQRLRSGSWRTTQSTVAQSSSQFANNHNDHKLASTLGFVNNSADYLYWTRISFKYEWFNNNTLLQKRVLNTGRC